METTGNGPPQHTAADYYGFFLEEVVDIIAALRSSRMEPAAIEFVQRAQALFRAEFKRRYPSADCAAAEEADLTSDGPPYWTTEKPLPWHAFAAMIEDAEASEADDHGIALLIRAEALMWPRSGH